MVESPLAALSARPRSNSRQFARPDLMTVCVPLWTPNFPAVRAEPIVSFHFCKSGLPIGRAGPYRRAATRSASLERGQDLLAEEPDVLLRERMGQRAELEKPHQHPDAQLASLGLNLANDVVGIADDRQAFPLAKVEVELVERQVIGLLDPRRPRRRRLAHESHGAAVVAEKLLPEIVDVRLGLLAGPRVRLRHVHVAHEVTVLGPGRPAVLPGQLAVPIEDGADPAARPVGGAGRDAAAGGDLEPLVAVGGQDDGRVLLLQRPRPDGHPVGVEVLAAPLEWLW